MVENQHIARDRGTIEKLSGPPVQTMRQPEIEPDRRRSGQNHLAAGTRQGQSPVFILGQLIKLGHTVEKLIQTYCNPGFVILFHR